MHNRIFALLCLAIFVALAPAMAYPAAAAPHPGLLPEGVRAGADNAPDAGISYLSIPAAAFTPESQNADYENHGRYIKSFGNGEFFRAPVSLPNSSTVRRVSACFFDNDVNNSGTLKLASILLTNANTGYEMASIDSATGSGFQFRSDETIMMSGINNNLYAYYLLLLLPVSSSTDGVWSCGVTIEYSSPTDEGGILTLPGAAFDRPFEDGYNAGQEQAGGKLVHFSGGTGDHGVYLAQVNLPQGAVVNKVTMYYSDTDITHNISLFLNRTHNGNGTDMANVYSVDGQNKSEVTGITEPTIDNSTYSYWAYVILPPTALSLLSLWAVKIEYTPHPTADDGWLNISDAAFTPFYDGYDYENHGRWLFHKSSNGNGASDGAYVAPVYLPQGATIDGIAFNFYDGSTTLNGTGILYRTKLGSFDLMASVTSSGYGGYGYAGYPSVIPNNIVDNSQYSYFVVWSLPATAVNNPPVTNDIVGCNVVVMFTQKYYAYLPAVLK